MAPQGGDGVYHEKAFAELSVVFSTSSGSTLAHMPWIHDAKVGLPGWKLDRVLRSVTVRRVRQLKRDFTPVEAKVDALAEGVDEMRKALHFVQNQLPKEQLVALGTVHAKVDARLSGVEGQLNGIAAALEQLAELDDARFS